MPNVYSVRLWATSFTSGVNIGPTVPAGFVWVVRSVTVRTGSPPYQEQGLVEFYTTSNYPICGWSQDELRGAQWVTWDGHHVLEPGETIKCQANGMGAAWMMSGYQLTLP